MAERTGREVIKEALGWACLGLGGVIIGVLVKASGHDIGAPIMGLSAALVALCVVTVGYELIRRD